MGDYERITVGAGSIIFKQDDPADRAYLIQSGRVEISCRGKTGQRIVLNELARGELLGEMALIGNSARTATASAISDVVLMVIQRDDFDSRISALDPVMLRVVQTLNNKLRTMSVRHVEELSRIR